MLILSALLNSLCHHSLVCVGGIHCRFVQQSPKDLQLPTCPLLVQEDLDLWQPKAGLTKQKRRVFECINVICSSNLSLLELTIIQVNAKTISQKYAGYFKRISRSRLLSRNTMLIIVQVFLKFRSSNAVQRPEQRASNI